MSLFDKLGSPNALPMSSQCSPNANQRVGNPVEVLQRIKKDPVSTLKEAGISVPKGMTNPQQIVQHLVETGQVPQNRVTRAMRMLQGMAR